MSNLMGMLTTIQSYVWGPPTLLLLIGTGLYFTIKLRGLQITKFPRAVRAIFEKESGTGSGEGDVSAFATLCTTMAADIGTGSIVGVATALRIGGPGSLFWMWISAILGMVTKYSESLLAVKYRVTDENNQMAGGPMFYIQNGMGERFIWLAKIFWHMYSIIWLRNVSAGKCDHRICQCDIPYTDHCSRSHHNSAYCGCNDRRN